MDRIEIQLTQDDFDNADGYTSNSNCILATAVKRQLGVTDVVAGGDSVGIDGEDYSINDGLLVQDASDGTVELPVTIVLDKLN